MFDRASSLNSFGFRTFTNYVYTRTATGMDGNLHTDLGKSETSREIKKNHFSII